MNEKAVGFVNYANFHFHSSKAKEVCKSILILSNKNVLKMISYSLNSMFHVVTVIIVLSQQGAVVSKAKIILADLLKLLACGFHFHSLKHLMLSVWIHCQGVY